MRERKKQPGLNGKNGMGSRIRAWMSHGGRCPSRFVRPPCDGRDTNTESSRIRPKGKGNGKCAVNKQIWRAIIPNMQAHRQSYALYFKILSHTNKAVDRQSDRQTDKDSLREHDVSQGGAHVERLLPSFQDFSP